MSLGEEDFPLHYQQPIVIPFYNKLEAFVTFFSFSVQRVPCLAFPVCFFCLLEIMFVMYVVLSATK